MCGFIDLTPITTTKLKKAFQLELEPGLFKCYHPLQIIRGGDEYTCDKALWQFLLENKGGEWKPSKYTSFNSRWYDGEGFKRSFQKAFKENRCIIPASGFVEGLNKVYHHLKPFDDRPLYFGGLYKEWPVPDGKIYSTSMITISPHPKFEQVHKKAMPLILPEDAVDMWLDSSLTDTEPFIDLMQPDLRTDFAVVKLKGWADLTPAGEPFVIEADR